ncbi:MAG: nicotinamide-nucleotide amidohydrolase family protein [Alphaproteobacteria bacterium]|nr:nicotinamide-nucleotide amidohydrolase family protein [Alphaproteobacteria bacterium]
MSLIKTAILSIGNELLNGQVLNSNAHWLAKNIVEKGLSLNQMITIGDNEDDIVKMITQLTQHNQIIIITGGLGTTKDDKTKAAVNNFFKTTNIFIPEQAEAIKNKLIQRNKEHLFLLQQDLAYQPQNAIILNNRLGLAPALFFNLPHCKIVCLPGIPFEMKIIFKEELWQHLNPIFNLKPLRHHHFLVSGMGESQLSKLLENFENQLPKDIELAYLPHLFMTKLNLMSQNNDIHENDFQQQVEKLRILIKDNVISEDNLPFEQQVANTLIDNNLTVSVAESCTGGFLSHLFTKYQGASKFFHGSITAYNNTIKTNILKITTTDLQKFGTFSEEITSKMAISIKNLYKTDYAIATNGFMDTYIDENGKEFKGLIWISIATPNSIYSHKIPLFHDRIENIEYSSFFSLYLLQKYILTKN